METFWTQKSVYSLPCFLWFCEALPSSCGRSGEWGWGRRWRADRNTCRWSTCLLLYSLHRAPVTAGFFLPILTWSQCNRLCIVGKSRYRRWCWWCWYNCSCWPEDHSTIWVTIWSFQCWSYDLILMICIGSLKSTSVKLEQDWVFQLVGPWCLDGKSLQRLQFE